MGRDRIGRAMDAGRRWAKQQIKQRTEITPSAAEAAAAERFEHLGMRHLFIISALEVLFESQSVTELAATGLRKKAS